MLLETSFLNLDANASYGVTKEHHVEVADRLGVFCNPSAVHRGGQRARTLLEEARSQVRELIGACLEDTLIFTSGATEANNAAICGVLSQESLQKGSVVLYGLAEHASVMQPLEWFQSRGKLGLAIPPLMLRAGRIEGVEPSTVLAAFMAANNESGEIFEVQALFQSVKEVAPLVHAHCDMVQLLGKQLVAWHDLGAHSASMSGHKIGSYPGVGALVIRSGVTLEPFLMGGPQEQRHRAGTENLPGIVSFGIMAQKLVSQAGQQSFNMRRVADQLIARLAGSYFNVRVNFTDAKRRLPNTLSITVPGVFADDLVVALDIQGIAVSSGAACASGKPGSSHVLLAYGFSENEARETIRVSVTGNESTDDVERFLKIFSDVVTRMRKKGGRREY